MFVLNVPRARHPVKTTDIYFRQVVKARFIKLRRIAPVNVRLIRHNRKREFALEPVSVPENRR